MPYLRLTVLTGLSLLGPSSSRFFPLPLPLCCFWLWSLRCVLSLIAGVHCHDTAHPLPRRDVPPRCRATIRTRVPQRGAGGVKATGRSPLHLEGAFLRQRERSLAVMRTEVAREMSASMDTGIRVDPRLARIWGASGAPTATVRGRGAREASSSSAEDDDE